VLWLLVESGEMGGDWADAIDPETIKSVLLETAFGYVWRAHIVLSLALVLAALWRSPQPPALIAPLAGVFLASLGFVGHAAMREGAIGLAERANQALHLLAGGFWLGALPPLLFCLARYRDGGRERDAATALRRFSGLGHVAVAVVLATGLVNTYMILGRWPTDFSSPYQACLAAKIALVALMALLALYNRYRLVPRLATALEPNLALLTRTTLAELALGGAVLGLVSAFATFAPA